MADKTTPETINEAVNAILEGINAPMDQPKTFIIGIYGKDEDRDDLDRRIKSAIKKDRFSPFDKFVGRGRGSAKNQQFGKHFKHK